jgi:gamma-glutamylcyclotransferase (GGCT)/AIG2-like uncharacterized protein YtfP
MKYSKNDKIIISLPLFGGNFQGTVVKVSSKFKKYYIDLDNGSKIVVSQSSSAIRDSTNTKNIKLVTEPVKQIRDLTLYFAYGSNMSSKQMKHRCPNAKMIDTTVLPKYKFIIYNRGYASIIPDSSSKVYGMIWTLDKEDEAALDYYEGVKYNTYYKKYLNMVVRGEKTKVLVYIASSNKLGKPNKGYLEPIIEACKKYFPKEYVKEIESWL